MLVLLHNLKRENVQVKIFIFEEDTTKIGHDFSETSFEETPGKLVEKIGTLVKKTRVTFQPIRCKAKLIINTLRSHAFKALKLFTVANSHNQLS